MTNIVDPLNIRVVAPSSPFDLQKHHDSLSFLSKNGFHLQTDTKRRSCRLTYLNGTDEERLFELQNALNDASCHIIWCARGGYGLSRILPKLTIPKQRAPLVVGFSDTTALILYLYKHGHKSIHASALSTLMEQPSTIHDGIFRVLKKTARSVQYPSFDVVHLPKKIAKIEGILVAANLCILTTLIGTPFMPSLKNTILILEDTGERPYRIDRMLTHLMNSDVLKGVKAIVLGHFTGCSENDIDALDVFKDRITHIPLFSGILVGHEPPNWPVPVGVAAQIAIANQQAILHLLEEVR